MSQQDGEQREDVCTLAAEARVSVLGSPNQEQSGLQNEYLSPENKQTNKNTQTTTTTKLPQLLEEKAIQK